MSGRAVTSNVSTFEFRSPVRKCFQIVGPFFTLSMLESAILVLGYLASVATFISSACRPGRWNRTVLAVTSLLFCFAIFPVSIRGTYDVDVRFLLPAYLLVFASRTPIGTGDDLGQKGLLVPLLACLLHDGTVALESRRIDKELSRCHEILQRIPPGQTILEVVVQKPHFGVPIYEHFAHWYIVEKNGRVSGTFGSPTWPYFEHFRLTDPIRYHPNMGWLVKVKPKVDPGRMMETYNFAMLMGEDQQVLAELKRVGRVVEHRYPITLLEISGFHHEPGGR